MAVTDVPERQVRTYGNWRKPASAGLLGLGSFGTVILMGGMFIVVLVLQSGGLLAACITALCLLLVLILMMVRDVHGINALTRISIRGGWWMAKATGANVYRSGPVGRVPTGRFQLPGLLARMTPSEHYDSYNRPFALLHAPSTATYSIVIGTEPSGAPLVDPEVIDGWVADWGHWLANLADEASVEAASVTIETSPDTGTRLRREVEMNLDTSAPAFAQAAMQETISNYPVGSSTVRAFIAITFNAAARPGGKKRDSDEMARDIAARLPGLTYSLEATGAGAAHPLTAQQLCELVRVAYDPAAAELIDDTYAAGAVPELEWADVGPSAAQANWASYRHDSGHSVTWSMTGAPRGHVQSSVLTRLLAPHRDVLRKRVTLLYRPINAGAAAGLVEKDLNDAQFRATSHKKLKARDMYAVRSAAASAQEEASGAGLVNFGMLVTATVRTPADEADAVAAIENLGATARLRLRPVYGSQDSAFAAALPLGIVLSKHINIPAVLRNNI